MNGVVAAAPPSNKDAFIQSEKAHIRYISTANGRHRLCMYFWPAKSDVPPKGVVQVTHGHGCYTTHGFLRVPVAGEPPVYEGSWVETLNQGGWHVFGVDNRGAGRSTGLRAYCDSFEDYVDDGLLAASKFRDLDVPGFSHTASLPLFVMGHSMGGCLAVMMALKQRGLYRGLALMAPMLSLEKVSNKGFNRYLRPLTAIANFLIPKMAIVQVQKNVMYPEIQRVYDSDPLNYIGKTRVRNAAEYLRVTSWLISNAHKVEFPFIVFHSEKDTLCDCDGSKHLYSRATSKDKQMVLINQMWHIITKEPGNEDVLKQILTWINDRTQK